MRLLTLLILLATLLQGSVPPSMLGRIVGCGQDSVAAGPQSSSVEDCCAKQLIDEPFVKGTERSLKDTCRTCVYCKVPSSNWVGFAQQVPVIGQQLVGDVFVQCEVRYLDIPTIPAVPPPKA